MKREPGNYEKLLGINIMSFEDGRCELRAIPDARYDNMQGRSHGGYVSSLIDTAMGYAVRSKIAPEVSGFGTVAMTVNFVGKIGSETGEVTCVGTVLHAGRTMLTAEATLSAASGKLLAHGTGTFLVYPKQA